MPKIEIKDKLLQVKVSKDFYERIVKYCQKYSASISAGATALIRRQLDEEERKGLLSEIRLPQNLMAQIERLKEPSDRFSDYVERVLWGHIEYRSRSERGKVATPYTDLKNDGREDSDQSKEEIQRQESTKKFFNQFKK